MIKLPNWKTCPEYTVYVNRSGLQTNSNNHHKKPDKLLMERKRDIIEWWAMFVGFFVPVELPAIWLAHVCGHSDCNHIMLFVSFFYIFGVDFVICIICDRIHRHALWIMGEYANSKQDILDVMEEIKKGLGDVC